MTLGKTNWIVIESLLITISILILIFSKGLIIYVSSLMVILARILLFLESCKQNCTSKMLSRIKTLTFILGIWYLRSINNFCSSRKFRLFMLILNFSLKMESLIYLMLKIWNANTSLIKKIYWRISLKNKKTFLKKN
jgi:hypothetical protein